MRIHDWPTGERPRERLMAEGPEALSDAELLAILLRTGTRGCSALDLARRLLARFDGLRGLLEAPADRLTDEPGLGPAKVAQLQAAIALARRHLRARLTRGDALTSPDATRRFLRAELRHRPPRPSARCCSTPGTGSSPFASCSRGPLTRPTCIRAWSSKRPCPNGPRP